MSQTFLLDTVSAIAILNGKLTLPADTLLNLPIIVLGELYAGAEQSARTEANRQRVATLAAHSRVVLCDGETAQEYGRVVAQLRTKGRPIPQNDLWIAALALQHKLPLLTRDAHFQHVDGLVIQDW